MTWKTKGMNRDLSVSAFNPEFSFENLNLRLSTNNGNTLMSWVNERGTEELKIYSVDYEGNISSSETTISGVPIGTAILNHKLVLFTTGTNVDFIYVIEYKNEDKTELKSKLIYARDLNFDSAFPLETLASYESEDIQKVYWVDGKNQPRVINIQRDYFHYDDDLLIYADPLVFDFVPRLALTETVSVEKMLGASGMFAPGVIQYAFTYYNRHLQESCIFYTTPLYYISNSDRGVSPEGKVENAFKIKVIGVDTNFDYLRIYSIQRTSLNATPICKRIQDIAIKGLSPVSGTDSRLVANYIDTGLSGDIIDPTELLYKGGQEITAQTLEQKDNTLFLGNIKLISQMKETDLDAIVQNRISISNSSRTFSANPVSLGNYQYANQLTSTQGGETVPCGGFKKGDYYRVGVQFQYKTGKWSKPIFIKDHPITLTTNNLNLPSISGNDITVPIISGFVDPYASSNLINAGYKKVRAVVVFPEMQDRVTVCQGVINPTVYTHSHRNVDHDLYSQASWFFRPQINGDNIRGSGTVSPTDYLDDSEYHMLQYANRHIKAGEPDAGAVFNPQYMRQIEIQGDFHDDNKFRIDRGCVTFNSPDIEFDDQLSVLNFSGLKGVHIGSVLFTNTLSDIDIQTETPTISNSGGGFIHKSFADTEAFGIVSGLFYEDFIVDDWEDKVGKDENQQSPYRWLVYPWNKTGSLNNDFTRPADRGVQSTVLQKKVISNLRYAGTTTYVSGTDITFSENPQLFSSNEVSILKLGSDVIYQGNVNTALVPDYADGVYFAFNGTNWDDRNITTPFNSSSWWKTFAINPETGDEHGIRKWNGYNEWTWGQSYYGDFYVDLVMKKVPVRMTYKSSSHLVFRMSDSPTIWNYNRLPIIDIRRDNLDTDTLFGGVSEDAKRENTWVPCGKPVPLSTSGTTYYYSYGDTYYQRWDCLKTYAFTHEDLNQVVEIGSFMLETRVNIDGRYDRNRGQMNNLNISPQNFNMLNPVYSQIDNFFSYKIMGDEFYNNTTYPNQVTWSKNKNSGADVDFWTNITLASVLELDGDKGEVTSIKRFNDQLIAFQDSGLCQILYNENTQISTTEGVPIEIANSGKVQGKRYISNSVGCSNKWSIVLTPLGIYFMDSNDKSIYLFNGQLANCSVSGGFNTWAKKTIPPSSAHWTPDNFGNFVSYYDKLNQDILFINKDRALALSERLGTFTSFYSYGDTPFFCNLLDTGVWIKADGTLWKHQAGAAYCNFFGKDYPYSMTLVGNPEPQEDKIFTNLEFRACVEGEYTGTPDTPLLPFDSLETWNEYQHGSADLTTKNGHSAMVHYDDSSFSLKRKFRIWRCDIPRNNYELLTYPEREEEETEEHYQERVDAYNDWLEGETEKGIYRHSRKPQDRMRNPWIYLKLGKYSQENMPKSEVHDIKMSYFT